MLCEPTLDDLRRAARSHACHDGSALRRFSVWLPDASAPVDPPSAPTDSEPREAGVLMLGYSRQGSVRLLLTRRTDGLPSHPGQISFPGGSREPHDRDLLHTALRETREELGLSGETLEVVAHLPSVYIPPSNFVVTPFVAVSPRPPRLRPDPVEVAEILELPLTVLLDPGCVRHEHWMIRGQRYLVPHYRHADDRIWGATARMLGMLECGLRQVLDGRLAAGVRADRRPSSG